MTTAEIILIITGISLVVITVYLARFLHHASISIKNINQTLSVIHKQIDDLGTEPKDIVHNVHELSEDLCTKLKYLDPVFRTVGNSLTPHPQSFSQITLRMQP